jgi:hypothetical protein
MPVPPVELRQVFDGVVLRTGVGDGGAVEVIAGKDIRVDARLTVPDGLLLGARTMR